MTTVSPHDKAGTLSYWPKAGASIAVFRGDSILLVERAKAPRAGLWSLPGGHIEAGEEAAVAALRELREETGVQATCEGLADIQDVIIRHESGALQAHYLLAVFYGRWQDGEPIASTDAADARFIAPGQLDEFRLTPGAKRLISLARAKLPGPG
jgi:8-oxo-dGTP diphosphatase